MTHCTNVTGVNCVDFKGHILYSTFLNGPTFVPKHRCFEPILKQQTDENIINYFSSMFTCKQKQLLTKTSNIHVKRPSINKEDDPQEIWLVWGTKDFKSSNRRKVSDRNSEWSTRRGRMNKITQRVRNECFESHKKILTEDRTVGAEHICFHSMVHSGSLS